MLPWKMFVRSAGAVALLTVGALGASQELPFNHLSSGGPPPVEVEETPVPEAPEVDQDAEVEEETSTTTTEPRAEEPDAEAPDSSAPEADVEVEVTEAGTEVEVTEAETEVEVTEVPDADPVVVDVPARAKKAPGAPAAPKPEKECSVTHPWKGDHNNDGHCDRGWHNKETAGPANKGQRPQAAPGQLNRAERHSEGRREAGQLPPR